MHLYYAVHFDQLEAILEKGLGTMVGETEIIPMLLMIYPSFAEVYLMMENDRSGVDESSEIVVLCINADSIEDAYLEPYEMENGHAYRYICSCIVESLYLGLKWADHILPLQEFMDTYVQLRDHGSVVSDSEIISKCVSWFMMESKKREAMFNIIGRLRGSHFDDLAVLTGYSADLLRALWYYRESVNEHYHAIKESREKGIIIGMYENGYSIEEIHKKINWQEQRIIGVLQEEGLTE